MNPNNPSVLQFDHSILTMDFLLGSAVLLVPQHQIPLAITTAIIKGVQQLRRKKHEAKRISSSSSMNIPYETVELEWSQLTCTLTENESKKRILLDNITGSARPGRLLAICGPSGSGKTTLLNALAGQLPFNKKMSLEGVITANNCAIATVPGIRSGFVAQEDLFFSQMTVKETMMMAAEMRSSTTTTAANNTQEEREATVDGVIRRLGLRKCSDTPVGDAKTRGLSGGEKKRLSIACELVARPQLIFADEPTSGLDAFGAQQVMQALKDLCEDGHTVIASIHQPRSSIFTMFDDLCLLSEGQLVYFGGATAALDYFEKLGHPCPPNFNPAEFLADLVSIDHSEEATEVESKARVTALVTAWKNNNNNHSTATATVAADASSASLASILTTTTTNASTLDSVSMMPRPSCSLPRQISLLFQRSWRQVTRDRATAVSRASSQISSALVFSSIYWRMGRSQRAIQDRLGLLQVAAVGTAMSSLIKTLNVFPRERSIVSRERARASYPVLPYLVSKLAAELPIGAVFPAIFGAIVYPATGLNQRWSRFARYLGILTAESFSAQALGLAVGAAAPSTEAALAIGPAVILVSIVFGGLFVNEASVPLALQWAPRTSLIKHAFNGSCINEFEGEEFEATEGGGGDTTGEAVLKRLAFQHRTVRGTLINQGRIMMFYWWATYCVLQAKKPKYLPLKAPSLAPPPRSAASSVLENVDDHVAAPVVVPVIDSPTASVAADGGAAL